MAQSVDPKQPNEILDYDIECAKEMTADDSVVSATSFITGKDDELFIEAIGPVEYSNSVIKIRLSGGTNLRTYKVTLLITTLHGLLLEAEFKIRIKDE